MAKTMRPIDAKGVSGEFGRLTQEIQGAERHLATLYHQRDVQLKTRAAEYGHATIYRELERERDHPTPIPPRVDEPNVRVRARETFVGEWARLPYACQAGAVYDVPESYAAHARAMFELVDPGTPLSVPAPAAWPR